MKRLISHLLELKSWEIKDGYLIVKGQVAEDGTKEVYETKERIGLLTRDSLSLLVVQEANPRLAFLYINAKKA